MRIKIIYSHSLRTLNFKNFKEERMTIFYLTIFHVEPKSCLISDKKRLTCLSPPDRRFIVKYEIQIFIHDMCVYRSQLYVGDSKKEGENKVMQLQECVIEGECERERERNDI